MESKGVRYYVARNDFRDERGLVILRDVSINNGPFRPQVGRIVWEDRDQGFFFEPEKDFALTESADGAGVLHGLAEALAKAGIVSSQADGELKATKAWLEDMRRIVMKDHG